MTLFILTETSAGYALLKAKDKKLLKRDDLASETESVEGICSLLKLKDFQKFDSAATALEEIAAVVEGKVTSRLTSLLDSIKDEKKVSLAVADPKLGNAIGKIPGLEIKAIADSTTQDLYRAIRNHLPSLIPGLMPDDVNTMSLGLSHSLARHKLKFSPDKIDTMIVQAIALLDDLDKELNTYAMRVKEWYGWHFPEMAKILNDNLAYAKVVMKMGMRTNWETCDLAEILPEEIETAVKSAADRSMGTEITQEDLDNIQLLAEQVVSFTEYRQQLASYLSARMTAIAPNLTALVGELVGARLIAHAGSLLNLSKSPASTIQILGAEKALFRALKTKHDTPKYGLIYHASLIGQASGKNKGKMARVLAAKAALGLRVDALQDWGEHEEDIPEDEKAALGLEARYNLERKLAAMEGKPLKPRGVAIAPNGVASTQPKKWEIKEARKYNPDADALTGEEAPAVEATPVESRKDKKKEKKQKLIEEVKEVKEATPKSETEEDETMADAAEDEKSDESDSQPDEPIDEREAAVIAPPSKPATNGFAAREPSEDEAAPAHSDTISTPSDDTPPSPDSPTQQERNWQSSILGNTKEAKKQRKIERHERKLAMSAEKAKEKKLRKEKLARRLDRKERREAKAAQVDRREKREEDVFLEPARKAGLSITRYKRKLERGEIRFEEDGTPVAISKKEIKKARKRAEKEAAEKQKLKRGMREETINGSETKKRKRAAEDDAETEAMAKSEKKKKKNKEKA
ncbi:Nucleolar protein 58 [Endocarpon pusillum]|uniref:Nucleolar protein 58 n=1 Tax=Endocarpon pusillum TaxID=364733 RepID=A0A8H7ABS1_9EURO|nr:Nucleolar protein 58 [Endocarpon pusillum]